MANYFATVACTRNLALLFFIFSFFLLVFAGVCAMLASMVCSLDLS